jgi:hypothetical protein
MAAMASPAPGPADLVHRPQLEKSVAWSGRERLWCLWYRLRLTVAEMNYATRRMVELQAPWISDDHPSHRRGTGTGFDSRRPAQLPSFQLKLPAAHDRQLHAVTL